MPSGPTSTTTGGGKKTALFVCWPGGGPGAGRGGKKKTGLRQAFPEGGRTGNFFVSRAAARTHVPGGGPAVFDNGLCPENIYRETVFRFSSRRTFERDFCDGPGKREREGQKQKKKKGKEKKETEKKKKGGSGNKRRKKRGGKKKKEKNRGGVAGHLGLGGGHTVKGTRALQQRPHLCSPRNVFISRGG